MEIRDAAFTPKKNLEEASQKRQKWPIKRDGLPKQETHKLDSLAH